MRNIPPPTGEDARLLDKESRKPADSKQLSRKAIVITPRKLGLPAGLTYDHIEQLLEAIEDPRS